MPPDRASTQTFNNFIRGPDTGFGVTWAFFACVDQFLTACKKERTGSGFYLIFISAGILLSLLIARLWNKTYRISLHAGTSAQTGAVKLFTSFIKGFGTGFGVAWALLSAIEQNFLDCEKSLGYVMLKALLSIVTAITWAKNYDSTQTSAEAENRALKSLRFVIEGPGTGMGVAWANLSALEKLILAATGKDPGSILVYLLAKDVVCSVIAVIWTKTRNEEPALIRASLLSGQ
jgi:hypothetical protein